MEDDLQPAKVAGLAEELAGLRALTAQLRAENARLLRLSELTPRVRLVYFSPQDSKEAGFIETDHFGRRLAYTNSYFNLTGVESAGYETCSGMPLPNDCPRRSARERANRSTVSGAARWP